MLLSFGFMDFSLGREFDLKDLIFILFLLLLNYKVYLRPGDLHGTEEYCRIAICMYSMGGICS